MTFYFGTNVKMHHTHAESQDFVRVLAAHPPPADVQRFYIPPYTSLAGLADMAHPANVWIGAQNMHEADDGEYTGEISAPMLRSLSVDMVMLGHAERRNKFGETDAAIQRKIASGARNNLRVLLCIGEDAAQRENAQTEAVLSRQLTVALADLPGAMQSQLMVAYEPVWSIGVNGTPATSSTVAETMGLIRGQLDEIVGDSAAQIPLLYGGSVNMGNCADYTAIGNVDGLFVGRAARTAKGYLAVLERSFAANMKT